MKTQTVLQKTCGLALMCLMMLASSKVISAPVAVVNPGFEDISVGSPFNEFTFGAPNGWELYDPNNVTSNGDGPTYYVGTLTPFLDPNGAPGEYANFPAGAPEGQRVGIAFNFNGSDGQTEYGLFQELSTSLQPFTTYTLEVGIGNIDSATAMSGQFFPLEGFSGYRVELQAGGMMLEEDDNLLAGSIPDGEFATSTVTFTTGATHAQLDQNLGILLVNLNQEDPNYPDSDLEVDFDDVRLDASPALDGDFNFSGRVDGIDLLVWQQGFPAALDSDDLQDWEANYGEVFGVTIGVVPEPLGFVFAIQLLVCGLFHRTRNA